MSAYFCYIKKQWKQLCWLGLLLGWASCQPTDSSGTLAHNNNSKRETSLKRVFLLNSYGFQTQSGRVLTGYIEDISRENRLQLTSYYMNAQKELSEREQRSRAAELLAEIEVFRPDVLILSGEPAARRLASPEFANVRVPLIVVGQEWEFDPSIFGARAHYTLVNPFPLTNFYAQIGSPSSFFQHVFVLGGENEANQRLVAHLEAWAKKNKQLISFQWVASQNAWELRFQEAQQAGNLLVLLSNEGIADWNGEQAEYIASQYTKQPSVALSSDLVACATFAYVPAARAQAVWAMQMAQALPKLSDADPRTARVEASDCQQLYQPHWLARFAWQPDSTWKAHTLSPVE